MLANRIHTHCAHANYYLVFVVDHTQQIWLVLRVTIA